MALQQNAQPARLSVGRRGAKSMCVLRKMKKEAACRYPVRTWSGQNRGIAPPCVLFCHASFLRWHQPRVFAKKAPQA